MWVRSVTEDRSVMESYVRQISSRMFGRQSAYLPYRDQVVVRPVGMIVEDLCRLKDLDWARYAFSREPLNGKFDDAQRMQLTQKALDTGTEVADSCIARHGTKDPFAIAKALGLWVSHPYKPQDAGRVLFAEFCPPKQVNIFMDAINRADDLMPEPGVRAALGDIHIPSILLAHELFHVEEEKQRGEIWTKAYNIELWRIGPLRNRSRVSVLSEIAAMGFSRRLNDLAYSPYVMDAFLVYGYSADTASRLYEEMMGLAGKEPRVPSQGESDPQ